MTIGRLMIIAGVWLYVIAMSLLAWQEIAEFHRLTGRWMPWSSDVRFELRNKDEVALTGACIVARDVGGMPAYRCPDGLYVYDPQTAVWVKK